MYPSDQELQNVVSLGAIQMTVKSFVFLTFRGRGSSAHGLCGGALRADKIRWLFSVSTLEATESL